MERLGRGLLPGGAGGQVVEEGGTVRGMLSQRQEQAGRGMRERVRLSVAGKMVLEWLRDNGLQGVARGAGGIMAPEDLTALASDMTVLVSCWE